MKKLLLEVLKETAKYIAVFLFVELGSAIVKSVIQIYNERKIKNIQLV